MTGRRPGWPGARLPAVAALLGVALVVVGCSSGETARTTRHLTPDHRAARRGAEQRATTRSRPRARARSAPRARTRRTRPTPRCPASRCRPCRPATRATTRRSRRPRDTETAGPADRARQRAAGRADRRRGRRRRPGRRRPRRRAGAPRRGRRGRRPPGPSCSTSADGRLVQSVSAYADSDAAVRAVATATDRLVGCGFTRDRDPRLGEASELLTGTGADGAEQLVVVLASEGVGAGARRLRLGRRGRHLGRARRPGARLVVRRRRARLPLSHPVSGRVGSGGQQQRGADLDLRGLQAVEVEDARHGLARVGAGRDPLGDLPQGLPRRDGDPLRGDRRAAGRCRRWPACRR